MQASIFIARLLGPLIVVVAIALFSKPAMFRTMLQEFIGSPIWLYFAGFAGFLAGMAVILTHNVWAADWRVIITLFGWFSVVRALISILQPQWIAAAGNVILQRREIFFAAAAVNLIVGLVLSYFGYSA